jgi:hypothetical protein
MVERPSEGKCIKENSQEWKRCKTSIHERTGKNGRGTFTRRLTQIVSV